MSNSYIRNQEAPVIQETVTRVTNSEVLSRINGGVTESTDEPPSKENLIAHVSRTGGVGHMTVHATDATTVLSSVNWIIAANN